MALDANYIGALARELSDTLTGARIDKIHQPRRDDIVIALRSPNVKGKKLLISANSGFAITIPIPFAVSIEEPPPTATR